MSLSENNLVSLLCTRSKLDAGRLAYRFILDEGADTLELTYGGLYQQALSIAFEISQHSKLGDRVLMMYNSSLDFVPAFFGCLLAGVIPVPAYPPRRNNNTQRLLSIIRDADVSLITSTSQIKNKMLSWSQYESLFECVGWVNTEEAKCVGISEADFSPRSVKQSDPMFLQYTSGSTGNPKGVIVTHKNMWANLSMLQEVMEVDENSIYASWLPYFHDMGLIGVLLESMFSGALAVMMSPTYFLQKPVRWLQTISEYGGTISGAPNFAYDLCVNNIKEEDLEGINLSSWRVAFNGAEPVLAKTVESFCHCFEKYGFDPGAMMPCFGLAEATLYVSGWRSDRGQQILTVDRDALAENGLISTIENQDVGTRMVSCGVTCQDHHIAIIDPKSKERCAEGQVGELWFKGDSVAKGYWNKPAETKETFEAFIAGTDDGPYLRTGDLSFMLDGKVYINGRLKDVLIIRGSNYYPQDLELTAWESHPDLTKNNGAVFTIDSEGEAQLVVVQEVKRTAVRSLKADDVFEAIVSAISMEYGLSVSAILLVPPGSVLKTSSGKVQRQANKKAFLNEEYKPLAQWNKGGQMTEEKVQYASRQGLGERRHELEQWLSQKLAELTEQPVHHIRVDKDFSSYGLDSLGAVQLSEVLQAHLGIDVPPGRIYDYPSISLISEHLLTNKESITTSIAPSKPDEEHDVAIIGMSGRFPGGSDIHDFESMLFGTVNAITTPGVDAPSDSDPRQVSYRAGYISDVDLFDAGFFEIAPKEAALVDPQQRLVMELCYTAMQNAGYAPQKLKGKPIGVFMGVSNFDYAQLAAKSGQNKSAYYGTGMALSIVANRVSYFFDFKGPSLCIETACSSSLVAVHQAVRSIRSGESEMALVGGVNLILSDTVNEYLDAGQLLAADGHCKTFDAAADGYVRGEGGGVLLLKSKKQAISDGDNILAVIKGSALVQDGHSNGLLAPNGPSQQEVIKKALADAQVEPQTIAYVEAHGTGTALGDSIEVVALDQAYRHGLDTHNPLIIGSVKANIGHLESAAGIAGLIKTVLCLNRNQVPGQVHFKTHNPNIDWAKLHLKVPQSTTELVNGADQIRAGVSSFGFGGMNAHVILEKAPSFDNVQKDTVESGIPPFHLVVLSAKSEEALGAQIVSLYEFLKKSPDLSLRDLANNLALCRDHFSFRVALKVTSLSQLIEELALMIDESDYLSSGDTNSGRRNPKRAFLFTGGGAQYAGMTALPYQHHPVFKESIDRCVKLANQWLKEDLQKILFAGPGTPEEALLHRIDYMQPALFAYEYAMTKLWMSWGTHPEVLIGHSLGEIVAACIAGVFSLEDGVRLICFRGQLMHSLPPGGTMISLQAGEADVEEAIKGYEEAVSIAVINGANQTVIAGEQGKAEEIKQLFDNKGVKTKTLQVSHASHSVFMEPILDLFAKELGSITFHTPELTLISNTTGRQVSSEIGKPEYWVNHLRNTVRFSSGIEQLEQLGVDTFIEVGPHPVLLGIAKECITESGGEVWLPSSRNMDDSTIYDSLGQYYTSGRAVNWEAFYNDVIAPRMDLPTYPFQKKSYWIKKTNSVAGAYNNQGDTSILGYQIDVANNVAVYESVINLTEGSYLSDHRVMNKVLIPASYYCDLMQIYISTLDQQSWKIDDLLFEQPLLPDAEYDTRLQLIVQKDHETRQQFTLYACNTREKEQSWSTIARGALLRSDMVTHQQLSLENKKRLSKAISITDFYEDFSMKSMDYGLGFQSVVEMFRDDNSILGRIVLPSVVSDEERIGYRIHPVLLDGCFQLLNTLVTSDSHAYLPFSVEGYSLEKNIKNELWSEIRLIDSATDNQTVAARISLWDENGEFVGEIEKLSVKRIDSTLLLDQVRHDYQYDLEWEVINPEQDELPAVNEKWLVVAADQDSGYASAFINSVKALGITVIQTVFEAPMNISDTDIHKIVVFWDGGDTEEIAGRAEANALKGLVQLQQFIQVRSKGQFDHLEGFWWITQGAHAFSRDCKVDPSLSSLWGLGRVFIREHQDVPFKLLDRSFDPAIEDTVNSLISLVRSGSSENELALDLDHFYALRLKGRIHSGPEQAQRFRQLHFTENKGFESLSYESVPDRQLGDLEVEIEVRYSGLNFRDIFRVLGLIPTDLGQLGGECSGIIVGIGAGVEGFNLGDGVMGLAEGTFADRVTTDYRLVVKKPTDLSFMKAATVPIAFITAWYGLKVIAQIQPGENILIHSAAGGVGIAAIQIAQHVGANIFGTASLPKHEAVRKLGVAHIYNSRTLDFCRQILHETNGKGVDVVLNSFIDEFVDKSLDLLSPGGRFLEIGKRDIRDEAEVKNQYPDISYQAYDLIYLMQHQSDLINTMLSGIAGLFDNGTLTALPTTPFAINEARQAFEYMSKARHTGKVVLKIKEERDEQKELFTSPSTVLISGGLGGLGIEVARFLVDKYHIAHLLLLGRSKPTLGVQESIRELEQLGTVVTVASVDVTDCQALSEAIKSIPTGYPLKGVFHLAGMLDDELISRQDEGRFTQVMAPKIRGAWHLHELTKSHDLDLFVLFSSGASILGSAGQSNYAAANAFLDSLAQYRHRMELPACSINWGPWEATGLVHRMGDEHKHHIRKQGIGLLSNEEAILLLNETLEYGWIQSVFIPIIRNRLAQVQQTSLYPVASIYRKLYGLGKKNVAKRDPASWINELTSLSLKQREQFLIETLQKEIASVLSIPNPKSVHRDKSLQEFGMDSLMAVQLRDRLSFLIGKKLPVTLLFDYPNVLALASFLSDQIDQLEVVKASETKQNPGWRDAVYSQLMTELRRAGRGDGYDGEQTANKMMKELEAMMNRAINGQEEHIELDDMSLEELENEFEKELRDI